MRTTLGHPRIKRLLQILSAFLVLLVVVNLVRNDEKRWQNRPVVNHHHKLLVDLYSEWGLEAMNHPEEIYKIEFPIDHFDNSFYGTIRGLPSRADVARAPVGEIEFMRLKRDLMELGHRPFADSGSLPSPDRHYVVVRKNNFLIISIDPRDSTRIVHVVNEFGNCLYFSEFRLWK